MPIYGQGFYGLDKYGAALLVDYKVDPFAATPNGYNQIRISWTSPTGDWDSLRLIQSRTGWASDENDGTILLDTSVAAAEYVDTGLLDGSWYYYTLWIQAGGDWNPVGTASALSVGKTGMSDLMWDKIPRWFHYQPKNPSAPVQVWEPTAEIVDPNSAWEENETLKSFLGILGWGMDYLRTYERTLMWANDTRQAHLANVYRLSQTLGEEWEPRVPAYLMRQKVQNAGVLAQKRGTLTGLRELVSTSVGYDVDLAVGPNLFLDDDQSGFENPQYDEWIPAINYAIGDLVTWNGNVWKAIAGALGQTMAPPATGTSNTWWTKISGTTTPAMVTDVLRDPVTNAIVTWKAWNAGTNKNLSVAYGVSDPLDQLENASNALWLRNTDATSLTYSVYGVDDTTDAGAALPAISDRAVLQGVPLPRLVEWDVTVGYNGGDFVVHEGVSYQALRVNIGREPGVASDWAKIGYDDRLPFKFSFWTHAGYTAVDNSVASPVAADVRFYDGQGHALGVPGKPATIPILDAFNSNPYSALQGRAPDFAPGGQTWALNSGAWKVVPDGNGSSVAWSTGQTGIVSMAAAAATTYRVAVTFGPAPLTGTQALIVSASAEAVPLTYVAVERTRIAQYSSGVVTASTALPTPIQDWDRVEVAVDGTAKTAIVYINGSTAASATLTFTITHNNRNGLKIG